MGRRSLGILLIAAVIAWGMFVRARRPARAVAARPRRARRGRAAAARRAGARTSERARIAREMHDVLAHRISLLSMHAGALEFRPDAPPEEIARGRRRRSARARTRRSRTCAR